MKLNKGIIRDISSSFKDKKPFEITLIITFFTQMLFITWFNLTTIKSHTGFDSSWTYLRSVLMWEEGTLKNPTWSEQNNFFLDIPGTPATLFYGLTKDIFLSFGITNIIILVLILWVLYKIVDTMKLDVKSKFFALNLVVCPYLTNGFDNHLDLGYFSNVLGCAGHASVRVLIALMIIYQFQLIHEKNEFSIGTYVTFLLCVLTGTSAGVFMIIMMIFPLLMYELEMVFLKNNWYVLKTKESIFAYICTACIFIGKVGMNFFYPGESLDGSRTWTTLDSLWKNMGAVILGFMKLLGVLPVTKDEEISIMSPEGITRLFPIVIFIVFIISMVVIIRKCIKEPKGNAGIIMYLANIIVCNFVTFSLFNVQYGQYVFEDRYLITTFFAAVVILAYYINSLDKKQIFSLVLSLGLLIAIIGNNIISDINYYVVENVYYRRAVAIDEYLDAQNDSDLVYIWGNDLVSIARIIRVYDTDRIYKFVKDNGGYYHWGDYTTYEVNADYTGVTYLIIDPAFDKATPEVLDHYQLVQEYEGLLLYRCDTNPVDFSNLK